MQRNSAIHNGESFSNLWLISVINKSVSQSSAMASHQPWPVISHGQSSAMASHQPWPVISHG